MSLFFAAAVALFADPANAAEQLTRSELSESITVEGAASEAYARQVALVIGINDYQDIGVPDLRFAENDAKEVAALLEESYGFEVRPLYGDDATRVNILRALGALRDELSWEDGLLIYWAGHGKELKSVSGDVVAGYFIPQDGSMARSEIDGTSIDMAHIKDMVVSQIAAKHKLVVIDTCFSGLIATRSGEVAPAAVDVQFIREFTERDSVQVLTAGKSDQRVLDGGKGGHSVFAYHLLTALRTEREFVTASQLYGEVMQEVHQSANARGHTQVPDFQRVEGSGDFVFLREGAALPPPVAKTLVNRASVEQTPHHGLSATSAGLTALGGVMLGVGNGLGYYEDSAALGLLEQQGFEYQVQVPIFRASGAALTAAGGAGAAWRLAMDRPERRATALNVAGELLLAGGGAALGWAAGGRYYGYTFCGGDTPESCDQYETAYDPGRNASNLVGGAALLTAGAVSVGVSHWLEKR